MGLSGGNERVLCAALYSARRGVGLRRVLAATAHLSPVSLLAAVQPPHPAVQVNNAKLLVRSAESLVCRPREPQTFLFAQSKVK